MDDLLLRTARPDDCEALAALRHDLWPDSTVKEHGAELTRLLAGETFGIFPSAVLVAQEQSGRIVGFLEVGMRSYAEGCDPSTPIGYLEGLYVAPDHRRRRLGARLVAEAEAWARDRGCREMASDAQLDNVESQRAHQAFGYEEVERSVNFRKVL